MSSEFLIYVYEEKNSKVICRSSRSVGRCCGCLNTNHEDLCDNGVLVKLAV